MSVPVAVVVSPRPSLWQRIRALFHWRSKAELLAAYEHERGLREAKEREIERLQARFNHEIGMHSWVEWPRTPRPIPIPIPGPGKAVSQ